MKKLFTSALIAIAVASFANAAKPTSPSSKKSESTAGLFKTDVDNYMNVTNWNTVSPEHLFGFLGYDTSIGGINWGLAHQFSSFYTGFYFGGVVNGFATGTVKEDVVDDAVYTTKETLSDNDGYFDTGLLFGFGNIGIKLDCHYDVSENNKSTVDTDPVQTVISQEYEVFPVLSVGLANSKIGEWDASYTGYTGFRVNVDKDVNIAGTEESTDDSVNGVYFGAGMSVSKVNENLKHSISGAIDSYVLVYPERTSCTVVGDESIPTYTYGKSYFDLRLTPTYTLSYAATDNLSLKFRVVDGIAIVNEKNAEKTVSNDVTVYNASRVNETTVTLTPTLSAALSYNLTTKKLNLPVSLNTGISIAAPVCGFAFSTTENKEVADGTLLSTEKGNAFVVDSRDGYLSWSSGFTFQPATPVTIDCSYKILANIFGNDFNTDFTEGDSVGIWDTVNKFIVHNIAFLVSVKF